MYNNIINISKKDRLVSVGNDEIIVNCKSSQDAEACEKILNSILNNGESVVSIDYMDFNDVSGTSEYELDLVKNIAIDRCSEYIDTMDLSDSRKCIICIVGNVGIADSTGIAEQIAEKYSDQTIVFGFIYEEYQENMFDMYVWKEKKYVCN